VPKRSAGLLLSRTGKNGLEVLLVHPGGPLWANKDQGSWSIPKGELDGTEDPLAAAEREFTEELGHGAPPGERVGLGEIVQASGKRVSAWAVAGDLDASRIESNDFEMEWPPRSGRRQSFPEVDRATWFTVAEARAKINPAQAAFIDRLVALREPPGDGALRD
jgi:predicted NUDIX family NTP pyrophosphohydrolase